MTVIPIQRILKFQIFNWLGTLVNFATLWFLHGVWEVPIAIAGACAIEFAIIHNYTWHYFVTWRDRVGHTIKDYAVHLVEYNLIISSIDFIINLGILWFLSTYLGVHYLLANLLGMVGGPIFKYVFSDLVIFKSTTPNLDKRTLWQKNKKQKE